MSPPKPESTLDFDSLRSRTLALSEERAARVAASVLDRHAHHVRRARVIRSAASVGAIVAVAAVVLVVVRGFGRGRADPLLVRSAPPASVTAVASAGSSETGGFGGLVLTDGSRVTFLSAGTELAQAGTQGRQSTLVRGAARFDVVHDARVPFRVTAGSVVVEDVGTVFTVRLLDTGATRVGVESGAVSVRGDATERVLGRGASEDFAPASPSKAEVSVLDGARQALHTDASAPSSPTAKPSWQSLARAGDYDHAYAVIEATSPAVRDDPEELLLASDAARLSGHPARAVPSLRRIVDQFSNDPRAGMAAMTLGRVLLDDLGQPREAAVAFEAASARGGPLAEDALARAVEAWSKAGEREKAKGAAGRYRAAYPTGRQATYVNKLVEAP